MKTSRNKLLTGLRGWGNAAPSLVIILVLMVYPLLTLFLQIVFPDLFSMKMSLRPSLQPFLQVFGDKSNLQAVVNSFLIGIGASVTATVFGVITAFAAAAASPRTCKVINTCVWIVFFAPSYIIAEGWIDLMQDGGIIAQIFHLQNGWSAWFFTKFGLIVAMGFRYFPFVHMAMEQAIGNLGNEFTNVGRLLGANRRQVFRKVTLPLLTPAILAGATIAFAEGFGDFGFAAAITPQTHIPLMAYQIYSSLNQAPVNYGAAAGLSLLLVVVTGGTLVFQMWWMQRRSYVTVSSGSRRIERSGTSSGWVYGLAIAIIFVGLIFPVGATFIESLWKSDAVTLTVSSWTFKNYTSSFSRGADSTLAFGRSLAYAFIAAIFTMGFGVLISHQMTFRKSKVNRILNSFLIGTIAIPGVVLAASYIFAWNAIWLIPIHLVLYGTSTCLVLAYIAGHLPYAVRLQVGSLSQLSPNLITAAKLLGARELTVLWRIIVPLVSATTISTFFLTFTDTVFELPASSLLYPAGNPPFPVLVDQTFAGFDYGKGAAMSIVGMIAVFGIYLFGQFVIGRIQNRRGLTGAAESMSAPDVPETTTTAQLTLDS